MKSVTNLRTLLKITAKSGAVEVLRALTKTNDFNEIIKITKQNRGTAYKALDQLVEAGLVEDVYDYTIKRHRYYITPLGKAILEKLEELETLLQDIARTPDKPIEEVEKEVMEGKHKPVSETEERVKLL